MASVPASLMDSPAAIPPPGVLPNFVNPDSRGPALIIGSSVLQAVMVAFFANRVYVKTSVARSFTWDDGQSTGALSTCLLGTLLTTAYYVVVILSATRCHAGVHQWDIRLGDYLTQTFFVISYLSSVLASPALLFIKVTFFLLYLQIFRPARGLRIAIWIGGTFTTVYYLALFIITVAFATPRPGEDWLTHIKGSQHAKLIEISGALPSAGVAIDLYIMILPLAGVYRLNLPTRRKIEVGMVFLTGAVAVVSSILSLIYRFKLVNNPDGDRTRIIMPVLLTAFAEMALGVSTSCMPAFSLMLRRRVPSLQSSIGSTKRDVESGASKGPRATISEYPLNRVMPMGGSRQADGDRMNLKSEDSNRALIIP